MFLKSKLNNQYAGKNVVVTGGSSGIGFAIAKEFALRGSRLFLIARNIDRLEASADSLRNDFHANVVEVFSADVTEEQRIGEVMKKISQRFGGIHVLILNAGITVHGKFEDIELEDLKAVMEVNYFGVITCLKAALPFLKEQENAQIGVVSSVAGYVGLFGYSGYAPTKFALVGLSECLRMELDISLTLIYPPDTQTPMLEKERQHSLPETKAISKKAKVMQAGQVARALLQGMQKGKFEVYCNAESRLIHFLRGFWPDILFRELDGIVRKARAELRKSS
ncbi:SDR family NAD(P)-dependent oxidoreductase [Neolewinella persica]|uniref:SDR family NAD(P)-dependent oxidoreductase n=1 Tax=Neolewinella persica TaxID=70998 RepID=UPI000475B135|nr:SDR family oxidoreductase [Neolewinella persica]